MGPLESALEGLEQATGFYIRDLEALTEEAILQPAAGAARSVVDFTYEVALINRRIAARFRREEPPALPQGDGWTVAPAELRSKAAIEEYAKDAFSELVTAVKTVPFDEWDRPVGAAGKEEPAFAMANFAAMHTMYHDAQLNFIQSINGDLGMHWF